MLGTAGLRGLDWARSPVVTLRGTRPPGRELKGSLSPRLVLARSHHPPAKRIKKQFGDSAPTARPQKTGAPTRSGQPSSTRMASGWVYWIEFLDRDAAFDRVPGKPVEVWSSDQTLARSIESV